jgi:uncharacterized protein (DUF58 family)
MSIPTSTQTPEQTTPERVLLRLDWQVIRRLDGLLQGDYRTLFYGFGVDFADLREYQPEDDIRYIDWNVTARMDTPYVRQYSEDRELTAYFLLDLSPSVDFGTLQHQKRNMLVDFVAVLARLLTRHGNRVGAMMFNGSTLHTVPARQWKDPGPASDQRYDASATNFPRAPFTNLSLFLQNVEFDQKTVTGLYHF